jgi:hypothetical protein
MCLAGTGSLFANHGWACWCGDAGLAPRIENCFSARVTGRRAAVEDSRRGN